MKLERSQWNKYGLHLDRSGNWWYFVDVAEVKCIGFDLFGVYANSGAVDLTWSIHPFYLVRGAS